MAGTISTITEAKNAPRDQYGALKIDFEEAIKTAYPEISLKYHKPGCWGANPDMWLEGHYLHVPAGRYTSRKHYHTAGHAILAIETARDCKLNLRGNPLFLLVGYSYNGDYRSLQRSYFLFGRNEDKSFFLHKVRPCVAVDGDLEKCRRWMWRLKDDERVVARQGDLGFISRKSGKPSGKKINTQTVQLGNHCVVAQEIYSTPSGRYFVLNAIAQHSEHDTVEVAGWCELRLAKAWSASWSASSAD